MQKKKKWWSYKCCNFDIQNYLLQKKHVDFSPHFTGCNDPFLFFLLLNDFVVTRVIRMFNFVSKNSSRISTCIWLLSTPVVDSQTFHSFRRLWKIVLQKNNNQKLTWWLIVDTLNFVQLPLVLSSPMYSLLHCMHGRHVIIFQIMIFF